LYLMAGTVDRMTSQHPVLVSRLITGVTVLLLVLGFGVGGLAAWSGTIKPLSGRRPVL
jgi:hypothetical protein